MPAIRGITICVGEWYARLRGICAWRNMRHLVSNLVVTDAATEPLIDLAPGERLFVTDAFWRPDADGVRPRFNKGLAMEEGLDALGRHGWILIHDADILLPDALPLDTIAPGTLYGARRRVLEDVSRWSPGFHWGEAPGAADGSPIGFFQLFHASDPNLPRVDPAAPLRKYWYDPHFGHAGGGDAYFLNHWPFASRKLLPIHVLHLGPIDTNWFGCAPEGRDMMARFVTQNRWARAMRMHEPGAAERGAEPVHRVRVPGYEPSTFELPFVAAGK